MLATEFVVVAVPRVATVKFGQVTDAVTSQLITCPSLSELVVNVALFVPAFTPSTFHWYTGLLPLLTVAVKTTVAPEHMGLVPDVWLILTVGLDADVIDIVIPFEVAVGELGQGALEVITHVTTWPFVNDEVENVALLLPELTPFTFH